jgi:hypothetical protein
VIEQRRQQIERNQQKNFLLSQLTRESISKHDLAYKPAMYETHRKTWLANMQKAKQQKT